MKHYLQVTDADFERASQGGAEGGAESDAQVAQNRAQQAHATCRKASQEAKQPLAALGVYASHSGALRDSAINWSGEDRIRTCGPV
jgi:hypothetical protein